MWFTKFQLIASALVSAGLALSAGAETNQKTTANKELKKLAGTWEVVSVESNGRKAADDEIRGLAYVFEASVKWKLQKDGQTQAEGTLTIDATKEPPRIDYKIVTSISEESKGKSSLGIYELDGDRLKVCRTWPDNDQRSSQFAAAAASKCILTEFKRKIK
jgi:uncharacterized protein (TIGR03067 family)